MRSDTLELLRCPYCGGRLSLVESLPFWRAGDDTLDGILGCHCCIFPVVDGIPILHLQPNATLARDQVKDGRPDLARRTMFGLANLPNGDQPSADHTGAHAGDESTAGAEARAAERFEELATSETATYQEIVDALGPFFEGGYFLYRFSDPTYLVAHAVVQAVASKALGGSRRAIDICGGSGHLTRELVAWSSEPPVLADLYYPKVWLARRFTAPGCEPVCCDGNAPLPFARGGFSLAMCTDAFMFIWTKRQFVGEMVRLIDRSTTAADDHGAVLIGHTHNERAWSPSFGQPLSPEGYVDLFETIEPRMFGEASLFADVVGGHSLDLSRQEPRERLNADPALTIIATKRADIFSHHRLSEATIATGEFRLNPLYTAEPVDGRVRLTLRFPSEDYEQEYRACREYLPDELTIDPAVLKGLPAASVSGDLVELVRRRIILDLPRRYY
ncbi:MAG TPA: hypothetical protein VNZ26_34615 [Vicinamibacterales bacterium]|jgi:uncharacterized protein YbaR (Trm112 family)|nr:hypothetical protein [Vicinamibacterales bacterium]